MPRTHFASLLALRATLVLLVLFLVARATLVTASQQAFPMFT